MKPDTRKPSSATRARATAQPARDRLALLERDLPAHGLVGELPTALVIFLTLTSRLLPEPASVQIVGPSSTGKSYTLRQVLDFIPAEAVIEVSSLSGRALPYHLDSLDGKALVIAERPGIGASDDHLRLLQSEGIVRHWTVEKTAKGLKPLDVTVKGRPAVLYTTTATRTHPENLTRILTLAVDDSAAQTLAVLTAQTADEEAPDVDFAHWHELQGELEEGPRDVALPWARVLPDLIAQHAPGALNAASLRRYFKTFLTLVRAHALLHADVRERDDRDRIVGTIEHDYGRVQPLVSPLIGQALGQSVAPETRETVEAVAELAGPKERPVQQGAIAELLGLHKGSVSRRVAVAIEAGYLRDDAQRKGSGARLRLAEPMPAEGSEVLPTPEAVQRAVTPSRKQPKPSPRKRRDDTRANKRRKQ